MISIHFHPIINQFVIGIFERDNIPSIINQDISSKRPRYVVKFSSRDKCKYYLM